MFPGRSLTSSVCQPEPIVGRTQPSTVIAVVRSSELESATETDELVPLNESALPNLPSVDQVAFDSVPPLLLPDLSAVVVPLPSSNPQAPTRPGRGPLGTTAVASFDAALVLLALSSAVTL